MTYSSPASLIAIILVALLVCALCSGGVVPALGTEGVRAAAIIAIVLLLVYLVAQGGRI